MQQFFNRGNNWSLQTKLGKYGWSLTSFIWIWLAWANTANATVLGSSYDAVLNLTVLPPGVKLAAVEVHESHFDPELSFTLDFQNEQFPSADPPPLGAVVGKDLVISEQLLDFGHFQILEFSFAAVDGGAIHLNPIAEGLGSFIGIGGLEWTNVGTVIPRDYRLSVFDGISSSELDADPFIIDGSGVPGDGLSIYYQLRPEATIPDGTTEVRFRFTATFDDFATPSSSSVPEPISMGFWLFAYAAICRRRMGLDR